MKYRHVESGYTDEAIFKRGKIVARTKCCDCSLVHDYTFTLSKSGNRFGLRREIVRNDLATKRARKAGKINVRPRYTLDELLNQYRLNKSPARRA